MSHSSSPSQSPSNNPQGWEREQHDHVSPVQSHPEKLSKGKGRNGQKVSIFVIIRQYGISGCGVFKAGIQN